MVVAEWTCYYVTGISARYATRIVLDKKYDFKRGFHRKKLQTNSAVPPMYIPDMRQATGSHPLKS